MEPGLESNFTSSIKGARYDTGFTLAPRVNKNEVFDYRAGIASGAPWIVHSYDRRPPSRATPATS